MDATNEEVEAAVVAACAAGLTRDAARTRAWAVVAPAGRYCSHEDCERCESDRERVEGALVRTYG